MRLAGYRIHDLGLGSTGEGYTYALAGNGIFLEAENSHLGARTHLAKAEVRGLPPLEPSLELKHGKVPGHLLTLALSARFGSPDLEWYAAITWRGDEYHLVMPPQERDIARVTYEPVPGTVVGIHSHDGMGAFFSYLDDQDDQGFLVSVVVGYLNHLVPEARARLCVYGLFTSLGMEAVFNGPLPVVEAP